MTLISQKDDSFVHFTFFDPNLAILEFFVYVFKITNSKLTQT